MYFEFRVWDYKRENMVKWPDLLGFSVKGLFLDYDEFIVMLFTTLRDVNDKKIFEGDILHCLKGDMEFYAVVYFEDGGFFIDDERGIKSPVDIYTSDWTGICEIVGNKYENPELIENAENS